MFYYISGKAEIVEPNLVVVDVNGVGYAVNTSLNTSASVKRGSNVKLYTYMNVKEDIFEIYGFSSQEELAFFKQLISISGVGVKAAVAILSVASPSQLSLAIITGEEKVITQANGVGKKIAQRIILELRDKIAKSQSTFTGGAKGIPASKIAMPVSDLEDALAALEVLGYQRAVIMQVLDGEQLDGRDTEDIIRIALKKLM
ncbi:MAG: Holliday junction branch migration protein RuvA [Clostridia bacterium]|nr:Holliday junction branch migration protein RuvA [Oscillospiraceae bacterium]MBQ7086466.1 Holliday junction branch migration protein RuvA [Clostridia bacterium]